MLSPLRPTDPVSFALEPATRNLAGPCMPIGGGVGHHVHRMDPKRPDRERAPRTSALDRPFEVGPAVGLEDRDPSWSRARAGGGTRASEGPTDPGRAGRLLEGLPVPWTRRDRAEVVRLLPSEPPVAGVLRRFTGGEDVGLSGVCPPFVGALSKNSGRAPLRDHALLAALAFGAGGAFDSEYPHFPQDRRSLWSARNVPGPHFGHDLCVRVSASPLTS